MRQVKYGLKSRRTGNLIKSTILLRSEKFCCGITYLLVDDINGDLWLVDSFKDALYVKHHGEGEEENILRPKHNLNFEDLDVIKYVTTTTITLADVFS